MRIATVRELRNTYSELLRWVEAGEEVVIHQRGKPVARLVPEQPQGLEKCDWTKSAALLRNKSDWPVLSAKESLEAVHDASGQW